MKLETKTECCYHFIYSYLYLLISSYDGVFEHDPILKDYLWKAYHHVNDIISGDAFGDIVEQCVLTVYEK